jgi:hypothetical protein
LSLSREYNIRLILQNVKYQLIHHFNYFGQWLKK